jgi:uncharacterized membrane protein YdbT with pleckstrin-like domain
VTTRQYDSAVAYPPKLLHRNESIVLDLRPHIWYLFEPFVAVVGALVLVGLAFTFLGDNSGFFVDILQFGGGILLLVCLVWFGIRYLKWKNTNFVVTTDRLIYRSGVISKSGIEIPLEKINTVFFHQGVFERMIGAGDLTIESASERGTQRFTDIRKPSAVQNEIYHQMEENEQRSADRIGTRVGQVVESSRSGPSVTEQIEELDSLRRKGLITEQEFAEKKAQLLQRM